ncbi:hypothetical protein PHMEG_00024908 [Phytophthora megakarya]|uniref:Uncharacterized protein n=1 Tax=Phytophthora megakarya TaxID=4795 RepID=A0A225VE23_9STRA|nr:hypothetical protein PHMEG_00024908 [Phytophthora megakarya]
MTTSASSAETPSTEHAQSPPQARLPAREIVSIFHVLNIITCFQTSITTQGSTIRDGGLRKAHCRASPSAAIRGNRLVQELVDAADFVESIYSAAIYPSPAQQLTPTELEGTLRGYVYVAQSTQKAAEGRLLTEIGLRENAEGLLRSCHQEFATLRKRLENAPALTANYKAGSDKLEARIGDHTEVLARSENRVHAAEDTAASLNRQLKHAKSEFMAKFAANTTQVANLSATLANFRIVDDSAEGKASRRCSDLLERNRRLMTANRTLWSRVKLDQLDLDIILLLEHARGV